MKCQQILKILLKSVIFTDKKGLNCETEAMKLHYLWLATLLF